MTVYAKPVYRHTRLRINEMGKFLLFVLTSSLMLISIQAGAAGDPVAGQSKAAVCTACHGVDGNSVTAAWPKIAGQHEEYIYKQLIDFKSGNRDNPQMTPIVATMNDEDLSDVAAYFSSQKAQPGFAAPENLLTAERMYRVGDPGSGLASCSACHGPNGSGNPAAKFPALSGQHAEYTIATLKAYKSEDRNNDPNSIMRNIASKLTNSDIDIIANYLQGLQ